MRIVKFVFWALYLWPQLITAYEIGPNPPFAAGMLVEAETGTILFSHNPNLQRSPASTQKILLSLVAMEHIRTGKSSLIDSVRVSARASRIGGSQVFLAQNEVFTLEQLMEAVVIPSANDACVAVAEHIGGSVENFVRKMNHLTTQLGLEDTYCVNVHGLDDTPDNDRNLTTAADLVDITLALLEYPEILEWSSIRYKPFRNGQFMLYNTNGLLGKYDGVDGLKTGYTDRAGSCLVATATRRDMRLVSVILGAQSERERDEETRQLFDWAFSEFSKVNLAKKNELIAKISVDWGLTPTVEARIADNSIAILNAQQEKSLNKKTTIPDIVEAPINKGAKLGNLQISIGDSLLFDVPIVAAESVGRMSWWEKLMSLF